MSWLTHWFHPFWTALLFLIFIGIVFWAYSGNRKREFEQAARLALDEDDEHLHQKNSGEQ